MVKTGNTPWWPFPFILWHFPKLALYAGNLTKAVKSPTNSGNPLSAFSGARQTGSASLLPIVHFSETPGGFRRSFHLPTAVLLPKWQKVMLFVSPDFLIFGHTFELPNRILFCQPAYKNQYLLHERMITPHR